MATIADVARLAGVSRSTASYALSGKRSISQEVRERVLAAVEELGYTPNAGARALATAQTRVIGLFAQFLEDEFAPAMLQYMLGVSDTARELGRSEERRVGKEWGGGWAAEQARTTKQMSHGSERE